MARDRADDESWSDEDAFLDDEEEEDEQEEALRFFPIACPNTSDPSASFDSLSAALKYDLDVYKFDVISLLPSSSDEDFFENSIIFVNKCRDFVVRNKDEEDIGARLRKYVTTQKSSAEDNEQFFIPVLADDAILMSMDDLDILKGEHEKCATSIIDGGSEPKKEKNINSAAAALRMRISALEDTLAGAKAFITTLTKEDDVTAGSITAGSETEEPDNDTWYFSGYSHHSIHETMLKDVVRTSSYENAIMSNAETLFKDKVVLDIGCGTGVLSIFAAKAGARKVIAVDNSDIIGEAKKIIEANGHSSTITCVRGKIEDLIVQKRLPLEEGEKVDVIVSEWMGYALLFETMLPSVMTARDSIMSKTGTMYPNGANILLEGASDSCLDFWDNVHGIDMTSMRSRVIREVTTEGSVQVVDAGKIVTNRVELIDFDLNKCKDKDLDFEASFQLTANRDLKENETVKVDKLVISFDIDFDVPGTNAVSFSTGCQSTVTHWKQTTLWFDPTGGLPVLQKYDVLRGTFAMKRNKENHREMDFHVLWDVGPLKNDNSFVSRIDGSLTSKLSA